MTQKIKKPFKTFILHLSYFHKEIHYILTSRLFYLISYNINGVYLWVDKVEMKQSFCAIGSGYDNI